eukprot:gnl/TRDRNA2_/TRDRNA2_88915_c0_seq1.p1 gnl/TRDRNA2_/TRDRNA2_88915_c0~~gnl/TRDRNA2_/TRDRNA2_88915_c0_seq1.p1  ORF type:complete len:211 (+),score=36.86 gnl/TRDRNA2_/TRDRNA2_88915_c0_seq1:103-735(+)
MPSDVAQGIRARIASYFAVADECPHCGKRKGLIFARRGAGLHEVGHEARCARRQAKWRNKSPSSPRASSRSPSPVPKEEPASPSEAPAPFTPDTLRAAQLQRRRLRRSGFECDVADSVLSFVAPSPTHAGGAITLPLVEPEPIVEPEATAGVEPPAALTPRLQTEHDMHGLKTFEQKLAAQAHDAGLMRKDSKLKLESPVTGNGERRGGA